MINDVSTLTQAVLAPECDDTVYPVPLEVVKLFTDLKARGFIAWANNWCCQTCGWAAVPDDATNVVFYHDQDAESMYEDGKLFLAWQGDSQTIVDTLQEHKLPYEWNGTINQRFVVTIPSIILGQA